MVNSVTYEIKRRAGLFLIRFVRCTGHGWRVKGYISRGSDAGKAVMIGTWPPGSYSPTQGCADALVTQLVRAGHCDKPGSATR